MASVLAGYVAGVHLGCVVDVSLSSPHVMSGPLGHGGDTGVTCNLGVGSWEEGAVSGLFVCPAQ